MSLLRLIHTIQPSRVHIYYLDRVGATPLFVCSPSSADMLVALDDLLRDVTLWHTPAQVAEDVLTFQFNPGVPSDGLTDDAARLVNEIHDRLIELQRLGVSMRTIREALLRYQQPSRLVVSSDGRFLLADYNDLEVPLTPICKALYLLFLQHPEGITFKLISEHRDELLTHYERFAPTINPKRRIAHVDALVSPLSNSLNEKVSLIRRAFSSILDEQLLPFYTIIGQRGGAYSLSTAPIHS